MSEEENKDVYSELYQEAKLTTKEIGQFPEFQNLTDDELEKISDLLFDIGITVQKIMIETND
ncbi:MAG: hypothetical protein WCJ95_20885 [Mariniphaga sp.]